MKKRMRALFLDIGGVLLTDGWNHAARKEAAKIFRLDLDEMEERQHPTFGIYEVGKITLAEYLKSRRVLSEALIYAESVLENARAPVEFGLSDRM